MEYIKLIALHIDDLQSSIFFEDNYSLSDKNEAFRQKEELESKGYYCILANIVSNLTIG